MTYRLGVHTIRYDKYTLHYEVQTDVRTHIRQLRQDRGISQAQLADAMGVSRQTIVSIENERYIASLPLAYRIARYFGKAIEDVFELSDEEE